MKQRGSVYEDCFFLFRACKVYSLLSSSSSSSLIRLAYEVCELRKMMSKDDNELCRKAMVEILNALEANTLRPLATPFRYVCIPRHAHAHIPTQ